MLAAVGRNRHSSPTTYAATQKGSQMAVFVSYARPDERQAEQVASSLRGHGYEVWRDDELPAHRAYAEVIQERLNSAKAVVVLWSEVSAKSQWVRAEADAARSANKLVQATLDGSIPPLPFNQIQCANLSGWDGQASGAGWNKLASSVAALVGTVHDEMPGRSSRHAVSICVLPFANMSGDLEQEYFSDGISEDVTTDLSKVSALEVIARHTAFQFKGLAVDVGDIARKLNVTHILEGSVRKAGNRVRITAQLIDGKSGGHVWAERYDRELTDIFAIQDEISEAIVAALKVSLLPAEKRAIEQRGTTDVDAYNLYLLARKYWITGNWGDTRHLELVVRICSQAVDRDPAYARAWGLLALVQSILHFTFGGCEEDGTGAAERALALDPSIAEAYCVRARHSYEHGRFEDADQALAEAMKLDPSSWEVNREAARIFYFERRFEDAVRHYERAVSLDDTDYHSWSMLCSAYEALGQSEQLPRAAEMAFTQAERVVAQDPMNGAALGTVVTGLAFMGDRVRADAWIERALLTCPDNVFMRYNFACVMANRFGDAKAAIELLEPLMPNFNASAVKAVVADPDLDSLRRDPRFQRMLQDAVDRVGIEQSNVYGPRR
jgi:adenylate cyclase